MLSLVNEGWVVSCFPPMLAALPCFWAPAIVGGMVTSRFVTIYIWICNKSPMILSVNFNPNEEIILTKVRSDRSLDGDREEGSRAAEAAELGEGINRLHERYSYEHGRIMQLCDYYQEIFGLRIFGQKITVTRMLQMATMYFSIVTIISQGQM
jgi:hypothetical protein